MSLLLHGWLVGWLVGSLVFHLFVVCCSLQDSHSVSINVQSIDDLHSGLKYGKHIDLPVEATFNVEQLGQLMASHVCIRPFQQLT